MNYDTRTRFRHAFEWLIALPRLRGYAGFTALLLAAGFGLASGVAGAGLAALLVPELFEFIDQLFLEQLPALFVALPLGLAGGVTLAATVFGTGLLLWISRALSRRLRLGRRLRAAWQAGRIEPSEA